ncbi:MAG: FkbM family methyltransferase [Nanoarchaeota archaeon]
MNAKEFLTHRIRDFDASLRTNKKLRLLFYSSLRPFLRLFRIEESGNYLIPSSKSSLEKYRMLNRAKTLDFLFSSKFYEPETTRYIKSFNGKTFLDIGSHIGRFVLLASNNFQKVCAIEPNSSNFSSLNKNISYNKLNNVKTFNFAISDKPQEVFMSDFESNTGAIKISSSGKTKVKAIPLSAFMTEAKLSPNDIDLILMDVENAELEVLKGADTLLKSGHTKFIIESFKPEELTKLMNKYGYKKVKTLDYYNHVFIKN